MSLAAIPVIRCCCTSLKAFTHTTHGPVIGLQAGRLRSSVAEGEAVDEDTLVVIDKSLAVTLADALKG